MQATQTRSMAVSKGLILTDAGLVSAEGRVVLGHREQFKQFAINTSAAVIHCLTFIFPEPVAIPLPDGTVQKSDMAAWAHYNQQVLSLRTRQLGIDETIRAGCVMLQWCQAALLAAREGSLEIQHASEFLAIEYLARHGAKALACSSVEWNAYLEWARYDNTFEAAQQRAAGYGRRNPLPAAVAIMVPWPEDLGAKFSGPEASSDKLIGLASDIIVTNEKTRLRIGGVMVRAQLGPELIQAFEASGPESQENIVDRAVKFETSSGSYLFRAQRLKQKDGEYYYTFRRLWTEVPSWWAEV